jgi:hypothetical protein
MIAYKFLRPDGGSLFSRFRWPLPEGSEPGPWVEAGSVDLCRVGIHACRLGDLPYWLGSELWEAELDGEPIVADRTKVAAPRGRLLRRVEGWTAELRDAYCEMCAARARERLAARPDLAHWGVVIEPSMREGPALLGFIAARIAEEDAGMPAYYAEREHQSRWLAERLGLAQA